MAKSESTISETIKTVFWALVIAIGFRSILFQPFWIPSESMKPTLLVGDFVFVNKMAYGYSKYSCEIPFLQVSLCPFIQDRWLDSDPVRGDVIVFRHPANGADMVKRLVGLPGDKVQVKEGVLFINGAASPQVDDGVFEEIYELQGSMLSSPRCMNGVVGDGEICQKAQFRETLPEGREHHVLNISDRGDLDNTPVYSVPEGHYFFMGDNRDNSQDSRVAQPGGVGFVPAVNLIGRADRVIFSSAGRSMLYFWTWRSDRFFVAVQ